MKKYNLELTDGELNEILSKLANELESYEIYGDGATDDLKYGFVKIFKLIENRTDDFYITTLVKKFSEKLIK